MPATIIVPGGGEFKRYKVPETKSNSVETCSPSPECSQTSFLTASMLTPSPSPDSRTSKLPGEDIFSDSSLIFIPSEGHQPKRSTSSKKVLKDVSGSKDVTDVYNRETGDYRNLTTKDPEADTEKGERPLGETKKAPKFVFGSTDIRYRNSEKAKKEPRTTQKASKQVSTVPSTPVAQINSLSFTEQTEQRADGMMKARVMELESDIVPVQRKEENPKGFQDLCSSDDSFFAEKANGKEERLEDCEGQTSHSSWGIPPAVRSPRVPTRSQDADIAARAIRSLLWESPNQPPSIVTPSSLHLIRREGDMLEAAVETLLDQRKIGVSLEGLDIGRKGELKFLVISTDTEVFIFDIEYFGVNAFKWGLYSVLGNESCVKVVHDFRASSDLLYHQFGLKLVNVFDTMAAHIVVTNWMVERKVTRAKKLYCLVLDYLGVVGPHLPGPCRLDTGTEEEQVMMAARNCLYLPALSSILETALELPTALLCQGVMGAALSSTDQHLRQMRRAPQTAPDTSSCLPLWKQ